MSKITRCALTLLEKIQEWWSDLDPEHQMACLLLGGGFVLLEICLMISFGFVPVLGGTLVTLACLMLVVGLVMLIP